MKKQKRNSFQNILNLSFLYDMSEKKKTKNKNIINIFTPLDFNRFSFSFRKYLNNFFKFKVKAINFKQANKNKINPD